MIFAFLVQLLILSFLVVVVFAPDETLRRTIVSFSLVAFFTIFALH